ncbi:MAG TPA: hypothetical protein VGA77_01865 [Propylenella sp.]
MSTNSYQAPSLCAERSARRRAFDIFASFARRTSVSGPREDSIFSEMDADLLRDLGAIQASIARSDRTGGI